MGYIVLERDFKSGKGEAIYVGEWLQIMFRVLQCNTSVK